jgi:hypothetical protein
MSNFNFCLLDKKYVNKSVYYKYVNDIYFNKTRAEHADYMIIPTEFLDENNRLRSDRFIINLFSEKFALSPEFPCNEPSSDACKYQKLLKQVINFYNKLQLAYNYINLDKGTCYDFNVPWIKNVSFLTLGGSNFGKFNLTQGHDLFVYLFSTSVNEDALSMEIEIKNSQFYKFFLVCCKIQKYLYSNFRERDNCYWKLNNENKVSCQKVFDVDCGLV